MSRVLRACRRALFTLLRAAFILLLLVIPVPVGELFTRLLERRRRAQVTQVVKQSNPD